MIFTAIKFFRPALWDKDCALRGRRQQGLAGRGLARRRKVKIGTWSPGNLSKNHDHLSASLKIFRVFGNWKSVIFRDTKWRFRFRKSPCDPRGKTKPNRCPKVENDQKSIHLSNESKRFWEANFRSWNLDLVPAILQHFEKWNGIKSSLWFELLRTFLDRKCKKGSPWHYVLRCFRNAFLQTCFFTPSTKKSWYFEKQKTRSKSVAFYNVCGALFSKKFKKGSPKHYDLQCFRNAFSESGNVDLV